MVSISLGAVALRLILALALGAAIGLERERGERAAGIKTLSLVSLGAALITIVSAFGFADVLSAHNVALDPSRIAAQIVSGIGFLGAGTIILRKQIVKGLTTAAAIWLVAGIGMACGADLIPEAIVTTLLALIVLAALRPVERRFFPRNKPYQIVVRLEPSGDVAQTLQAAHVICKREGVPLDSVEARANGDGRRVSLACHATHSEALIHAIAALQALPGVRAVQADLRGIQPQSHTDDESASDE